MAKRSDFAQKLLDDLRLRKERLAASQSSNRTNTTVADAYAYAKKNYRGSRGMKTTETTGFRTGATQNRSSGGNKSFTTTEAAKQIVPFGRGQSSEQMGDLSRALAFALENGGKLRRMDSSGSTTMLAFLNQLGRGSMDYTKMERRNIIHGHRASTNHFPTLSHVNIEEISRGAQKLNQILRACSNGLNFDRYSIEIGKELLKGAIDLEESLWMLVNLQEASEYMVSPQRKNRITLLEEDEDEDDNIVNLAEQKQLDRPRFSFDKRSRNYQDIQEVARSDLKMRLAALTYPLEVTNFIYERQSSSHKRSTSSGPNAKTFSTFSQQKNHTRSSQSKVEKARIPNVIAKLMGLEELPENEDSKHTTQKDSGSKQKVQEKNLKTVQGSTKNAKKRTDNSENLAPPTAKQKTIQTNKIHALQNNVSLQGERNLVARNANFQPVIHDGKPPWKELEDIESVTGFEKTDMKVDKQQSNIAQMNANIGRLQNFQENQRDQKGAERSKTKETVLKDELQRMTPHTHKMSEAGVMSPEKTGFKEGTLRTENNYPNKLFSVTQGKPRNNLGLQQPHRLRKSEPRNQAEETEQQNAKQKFPVRKQKGSEPIFTALSKPRHDEINLQKKQSHRNQAGTSKKSLSDDVDAMRSERIQDFASTRYSASRTSNQDASPRDLESKLAKQNDVTTPLMEKKPVRAPDIWKAESIKLHKREIPKKINEVMIKRGGNLQNSTKALKLRHSILQEVKHRSDKLGGPKKANHIRASKSKEIEVSIIKSNISVASIKPSTGTEQLHKEAEQVSILYSPAEVKIQSLNEPQTLTPGDSEISILMNDQQGEKPVSDGDEELKSHIIESNSLDGIRQGSSDFSYSSQIPCQKIIKSEKPESLSESENHLKKILIKSQVFLHTAEALFKLNIPFDVLHACGHDCQDEERKLMLDCGYEVMKRRGRKQELNVHPFIQVSITATKAKSLDNLVRELHKDIEKLKFYGRNGNAEVAVEDYLPKMLENDVYSKDPDVNCMWDLSWNEMMFAFLEKDDVIRDVERYVLNGLVDEITTDLHHVQVQAF